MKKIFKIASYDFRRLMFNPFSLIALVVALIGILILGATYKIPTAPNYAAVTTGQTTREIFDGFNSSNPALDTKTSLLNQIEEAQKIIDAQLSEEESQNVQNIAKAFQTIADEVEKYKKNWGSIYVENGNYDDIIAASNALSSFVENYKAMPLFESKIFFENTDFQTLESLSNFFKTTTNSGATVENVLDTLWENFGKFQTLQNILQHEIQIWKVDETTISKLQNYVDRANAKALAIEEDIKNINGSVYASDVEYAQSLKNLITNYKLTCESAKAGVQNELHILLENHFKSVNQFYKYQSKNKEECKIALTKINFFLNDPSTAYTEYQVPLNFNTASVQVTAYDNAYFMMSIIGFFTIAFGIFCAYKLFGRDRKTGQMDVILSQDVSFGQVFAAKTLAIILCTCYVLGIFLLFSFVWSLLFYPTLTTNILAVFNLSNPYTIHPFLFLIIKIIGIELQVIFWAIITIFLMNLSRKFEVMFAVSATLFVVATICNIFLNGSLAYCLFPFIHADLTCMLGGGKIDAGFLQTPLYAYGNFFISLAYYAVVVVILYNFTKQLFKKN